MQLLLLLFLFIFFKFLNDIGQTRYRQIFTGLIFAKFSGLVGL